LGPHEAPTFQPIREQAQPITSPGRVEDQGIACVAQVSAARSDETDQQISFHVAKDTLRSQPTAREKSDPVAVPSSWDWSALISMQVRRFD